MARVFLIAHHYMGVCFIDELLKAGDEIVGVVTWPGQTGFYEGWYLPPEYDTGLKAFKQYLPLYEPDPSKLNSPEFVDVIRCLAPDYIISGYYSKIFKQQILSIPPRGCINIHPTGLPRYRGLSPYFTHMLFGDTRNYITMHWLNPGVDKGDIIAQASVEILPDDTGFSCGHRLTEAGAAMFAENWPLIKENRAPRLEQDESQASSFNFSWTIAEIDWRQPNTQIWNLVRCLTRPLGGAWTMLGGHKIHIWAVRPVPTSEEITVEGSLPGEILAVTGKGLWVSCGKGQVQIVDATLDDLPGKTLFDVVSLLGENKRILIG
jgi:methionyl-tRNA formyltransferase